MLILYLFFLITTLFWVATILLPEMTRPNLLDFSLSNWPDKGNMLNKENKLDNENELDKENGPDKEIEKLETLLAEKKKNIGLLQTELSIFHAQVNASDKLKTLLDEEIHRLREQNRIFRSELGMPPITSSRVNISGLENSRTQ